MEAIIPFMVMFIYFVMIVGCAIALIYFIIKRIEAKGNEGFEERDW